MEVVAVKKEKRIVWFLKIVLPILPSVKSVVTKVDVSSLLVVFKKKICIAQDPNDLSVFQNLREIFQIFRSDNEMFHLFVF